MKSQALLMQITYSSKSVYPRATAPLSPRERGFLVRMYFRSLREDFITACPFFFFFTFIPETFCVSQFNACMPQYVGVLQAVRLFLHNQECLIDIFNYALNCINKNVGITAISDE